MRPRCCFLYFTFLGINMTLFFLGRRRYRRRFGGLRRGGLLGSRRRFGGFRRSGLLGSRRRFGGFRCGGLLGSRRRFGGLRGGGPVRGPRGAFFFAFAC